MKKWDHKKLNIWDVLSWIFLLAGFVFMLAYHLGPGKALIDGDMGGEMILSDLLNQEGAFLLSDNWFHATEIHVFFMQIVFRPMLLLFPANWHAARVCGMVLIYIINTIGYLLMMREMGFRKPAVWSAACLLWPIGAWRLNLGVYGGQYLVYDFFAFYIIWLMLWLSHKVQILNVFWKKKLINETGNKAKIRIVIAVLILAFLSFAGGVNGVRETMMLFGPMCLGICALLVIRFIKCDKIYFAWKTWCEDFAAELNLFVWLVFATFCNVVGYAFNLLVLMRHYSYQSNTAMIYKEQFSLNDMIASISDYFSLFGYGGKDSVFSVSGICTTVAIFVIILMILMIIRLFTLRNRMSLEQEFLFASFVSGLIFCSVIFGLMIDMNKSRFWLPFLFFGIALFELEGELEDWKLSNLKGVVTILLSCCIVLISLGTIRNELKDPYAGKIKHLEMAQFLDQSGLKQGYGEFWLANTLTEQTSGRVVVRPLMYSESFEMMPWSNRIDYVESYPEGEVFLVLDKKSYPGDVYENYAYKYTAREVIRDDEDWLVMVCGSAQELALAYQTALDQGEVLSQSEKVAGQ